MKAVDDEAELIHEDGCAYCPHEDCDWWVPAGMEYLYAEHRLRNHDE